MVVRVRDIDLLSGLEAPRLSIDERPAMRSSAVSGSSFSKISFFAAPSASLRGLNGLDGVTATGRVGGKLRQSLQCALIHGGRWCRQSTRGESVLRLRPA